MNKKVRRIFIYTLVVLVGGVLLMGGGCGINAWKYIKAVMSGDVADAGRYLKPVLVCGKYLPLVNKLEKLTNKKYIVLLQNNTELRASGGFPGSYARVVFEKGVLKQIFVNDIYQPDGQIGGHVEPPYPVQEAFKQGWWKLRDANWDVDFASAAATEAWFFEQGGESGIGGIIAVNLDLLGRWLEVIGPVKLATYDETVTSGNLYALAQRYAETRIRENITLKKEFLGAAGAAIIEKTKTVDPVKLYRLVQLLTEQMNKKQILVWFADEDLQKEVEQLDWAGRLWGRWNGQDNYLYVVDSNMGANKANCCIDRKVEQEIDYRQNTMEERLKVVWNNENEFSGAKPPVFWGGDYLNYVRIVVPVSKEIKEIKIKDKILREATTSDFLIPNSLRVSRSEDFYVVEKRDKLKIIGFWIPLIAAKNSSMVEITLESPSKGRADKIYLRRQPGVSDFSYKLLIDGKIKVFDSVDKDRLVIVN
jgi:hypothetical protein